MNLQGPADESVSTGCPHDHLHHESKRHTICKDCKRRMVRDKGDWKASSEPADLLRPVATAPASAPVRDVAKADAQASGDVPDHVRRVMERLASKRNAGP